MRVALQAGSACGCVSRQCCSRLRLHLQGDNLMLINSEPGQSTPCNPRARRIITALPEESHSSHWDSLVINIFVPKL